MYLQVNTNSKQFNYLMSKRNKKINKKETEIKDMSAIKQSIFRGHYSWISMINYIIPALCSPKITRNYFALTFPLQFCS